MPSPDPCVPCCSTPTVTNVPGPAGLTGATGPTGPTGPAGAAASLSTISAYGSGTAYTMATSGAAPASQVLALGTTQPSIVLTLAGTYLFFARVRIDMTGLTLANTTTTITTKLRCINNTVGDVANTQRVFDIYEYLSTLGTGTLAELTVPVVSYVATAGDNIQIWGNVSAATSAGTITCVEADIIAVKIA